MNFTATQGWNCQGAANQIGDVASASAAFTRRMLTKARLEFMLRPVLTPRVRDGCSADSLQRPNVHPRQHDLFWHGPQIVSNLNREVPPPSDPAALVEAGPVSIGDI
jgi:hypothetical protein